jgi:hypothetical protein
MPGSTASKEAIVNSSSSSVVEGDGMLPLHPPALNQSVFLLLNQ